MRRVPGGVRRCARRGARARWVDGRRGGDARRRVGAAPPAPASDRVGARPRAVAAQRSPGPTSKRPMRRTSIACSGESALADLLTRAGGKRFSLGNGYVTLGAGTRAVAPDRVAGEGYDASEEIEGGTAAEVFARRTGLRVDEGLVQLGIEEITRANDEALFDASVGALADALAENGSGRAVIGNADARRGRYGRGRGPGGATTGGCRVDGIRRHRPRWTGRRRPPPARPARPFGVLLAPGRRGPGVRRRMGGAGCRARRGVRPPPGRRVPRVHRLRHRTPPAESGDRAHRRDRRAVAATRRSRTRCGRGHRAARVTGVGWTRGHRRAGARSRTGVARSREPPVGAASSTSVDVAPTILSMLGVERPDSMEGRVMSVGSTADDGRPRIDWLIQTSRDSVFRDNIQGVVALVLVVLCALLAFGAALALSWVRRALVVVEWGALGGHRLLARDVPRRPVALRRQRRKGRVLAVPLRWGDGVRRALHAPRAAELLRCAARGARSDGRGARRSTSSPAPTSS